MVQRRRTPTWRERSRWVRWYRLWRTRRPVTFTQKVRYKMLRDRRPLVVTFADKAAVRRYVAAAVGEEHLPRLHLVVDDPEELARADLPDEYVVKPTHGSGAAVVVTAAAPAGATLPAPDRAWSYARLRAEAVDRAALVTLARAWVSHLYGDGPNREWAYGRVPPRVLVEELLAGPDREVPDDHKLFVFHGPCRYVQVDRGRFTDRTQDFFDRDWTHLPLSGGPPWSDPEVARPARLAEMIAIAERLGRDTDFVRVDLYVLPDRVVVGELTSSPAAGDSPFHPAAYDREFGRHWRVPHRYG